LVIDGTVSQPGVIEFNSTNYSVNEDGTPVTEITLVRSGGSDGSVNVTVTPSNGSASAPDDYTSGQQVATFLDGQTQATVTIPIVEDTILEGDETVNLALSDPTNGATLGTQTTAILTIVDDEENIPGTNGRDVINGGPGNDVLTGYQGRDILTGGEGSDIFVYTGRRYYYGL
jgi:Ca2+-binding RTX toxin-like protein